MFRKIFPIGRRGQVVFGLIFVALLVCLALIPGVCYGQGAETAPTPAPTPVQPVSFGESAERAIDTETEAVWSLTVVTLVRGALGWLGGNTQNGDSWGDVAAASIPLLVIGLCYLVYALLLLMGVVRRRQ